MKWKPAPRVLVLVVALALSLSAIGGWAQPGNLLVNPGFEPPYVDNGGQPPRLVAQGWAPWNLPPEEGMSYSQMLQPEYYPASSPAGIGSARVRTGAESQRMQIFFGTFTAGVAQTVGNLTAGQDYTFGAYVYVWSSSFDDPNVSQQDGGVTVQVGFDPNGGSDPESTSIVWSSFVAPSYDKWTYYSVVAPASGNTGSVWIRATVTTPVKNTVVFMDDAILIAGTDVPLPATEVPATAIPPTSVPPTTVPPSATPLPTNTLTPTVTLTPTITLTPSPYPTVDNTAFPGRTVYIVKQNDTVAIIAAEYGTSIQAILAANNLSPEGLIFVGQTLIIPLSSSAPTTAPPTTVPPTTVPPTVAPPTAVPTVQTTPVPVTTYVVRPGDTLFGIALRYNTTVSALQQANNIANPNLIFVGQTLVIPQPGTTTGPVPTAITIPANSAPTAMPGDVQTHRVQPGDNLYGLAFKYGTTVAALVEANGIANPNLIFVGEVLTIP